MSDRKAAFSDLNALSTLVILKINSPPIFHHFR